MINMLINDVNDEAYLLSGHMVHVAPGLEAYLPIPAYFQNVFIYYAFFQGRRIGFFDKLSTFLIYKHLHSS